MKTVEQHYREIAPKLMNYFMGNGANYADACEIVQETFARLWKMRDQLRDDDAAVSGLVYTIARNIRNDRARHGRFEVFATAVVDGEETNIAPEPSVPAPETLPSDRAFLRRRILEALSKLPEMLREAYTLFHISELSIREIAAQTGVTENLVKVRIHRAKMKLRESLADLADRTDAKP